MVLEDLIDKSEFIGVSIPSFLPILTTKPENISVSVINFPASRSCRVDGLLLNGSVFINSFCSSISLLPIFTPTLWAMCTTSSMAPIRISFACSLLLKAPKGMPSRAHVIFSPTLHINLNHMSCIISSGITYGMPASSIISLTISTLSE